MAGPAFASLAPGANEHGIETDMRHQRAMKAPAGARKKAALQSRQASGPQSWRRGPILTRGGVTGPPIPAAWRSSATCRA